MKVVKFGGSSLASATQFKKVHDIVLEDTDRHYVVPSAPGKRNKEDTKVTDLLILAYSHHNKDDFEEIYDRIKERYNEIITELGLDISLEEDFKEIKEEIKKQNSFDYTISDVMQYKKGDAFLLCTDGFWENVVENQMEYSLNSFEKASEWQKNMCKTVSEKKNDKNLDNYTSIAVKTL